jgi:putative heme iron utilization protein
MTNATTNQHAGGGSSPTPNVPEPSFAEQARTLMYLGRVGTLSTQLHKHPGFPFGSIAPYGLDACGRPTFLISTMAVHTQNLLADPHASLLVTQPGWTEDPLAGARLTLVGSIAAVGADDRSAARDEYLCRHENAQYWVDFDDFGFYRMEVEELYYVAGFGAMGWVAATAYRAAEPDPLAVHAAGILAHMNADHADALVLYCQAFAGMHATQATMTGIDRMGFRVRARTGERLQGLRINFPRDVRTPMEARAVLVEMVRTAREKAVGG